MTGTITASKIGDRQYPVTNTIEPLAGASFLADGTAANDHTFGPTDGLGVTTSGSIPNDQYVVSESISPAGFNPVTVMCLGPFNNPVTTPYEEVVSVQDDNPVIGEAFINWRDNPAYPLTCGLKIALILDRSSSIDGTEWDVIQAASVAFVNALVGTGTVGTPSQIMLIGFGTNASIIQVNGNNWTGIFTQPEADQVNAVINALSTPPNGQYTNWDQALRLVVDSGTETAVIVTDGNPTAYNNPTIIPNFSGVVTRDTMEAAIATANLVKSRSPFPKIVGVGIGNDLSIENLRLISGPIENNDYYMAEFNNLTQKLNEVAVQLCGTMICIHQDSVLKTSAGLKFISDIKTGDLVLDYRGEWTRISQNVSSEKTTVDFIRIQKDAFGDQQPNQDLLLTEGHPLLVRGHEISCEKLVGRTGISRTRVEKGARVYTLCTENRTFVNIHGLCVGTWNHDAFENMLQNDPRYSRFRMTYQ